MAWYREWFGAEYLELYAHRDGREAERHIDFVEDILVGTRPRAVLDLACGAGRHTEVLRRRGYRALGVDLSLTLLARRPHLPRVAGDMRLLPFAAGSFDWVLNFFTSFGYFESEPENFRVLGEIARVLRPGGSLLVDLFNLDHVLAHLEPQGTVEVEGRRIDVERWYDERTRRLNKRIRVHVAEAEVRTFVESVRAYRPQEVHRGLEWSGLQVGRTFGDFEGGEFDHDSPRLIILATRPA